MRDAANSCNAPLQPGLAVGRGRRPSAVPSGLPPRNVARRASLGAVAPVPSGLPPAPIIAGGQLKKRGSSESLNSGLTPLMADASLRWDEGRALRRRTHGDSSQAIVPLPVARELSATLERKAGGAFGILYSAQFGRADRVVDIIQGSPADKVGMQPFDRIRTVDGIAVGQREMADLFKGRNAVHLTFERPPVTARRSIAANEKYAAVEIPGLAISGSHSTSRASKEEESSDSPSASGAENPVKKTTRRMSINVHGKEHLVSSKNLAVFKSTKLICVEL